MERSGKLDDKTYCFADYRFIPAQQLLMLGDDRLRVGARALDLLHILLVHAGEVVSKEQLMTFAWPDTFVHESNLKVNIAALRRALTRTSSGISCIATVSGRGYRFVSPLRVYGGSEPQSSSASAEGPSRKLPDLAEVIGRDDVIVDLASKFLERRFLTVVGPAGVGKTTVAIALAKQLEERYRDGVCFVDLSVIGDPQLVESTIAASLGVGSKWTNILAGVVEALRGREKLLVLDNCEHVLSTTSAIAEHLTMAIPGLRILATSREPLRSRSEKIIRLSPLPYPDAERGKSRNDAMAFPAVDLFAKRASEICGYCLDDADAALVTAICRRLDGIALAIELAAARMASLKPATLLQLLEHSFEPLNTRSGESSTRHETLFATLDWSYQLLSTDEAKVLRMLSVFSGTFSVSDAYGVASHIGRSAEEIAECTESLASKSLLSATYQDGVPIYRLLDSTRSFLTALLEKSGEYADAQSCHSRYLLQVFEKAEAEWEWRPRSEWTASYEPRINDLRKAIDWTLGDGRDPEVGVRLTCAAIALWDELSTVAESRQRVERALQAVEGVSRCSPAVRMKLIASFASGLNFSDHFGADAAAAWTEANRLAREIGNVDYQFRTLWGLGILQSFTGQHKHAMATLEQFARLADHENERSVLAEGERVRLMAAFYGGDVRRAYDSLKKLVHEHALIAKRSSVARFQIDRFVSIRVALATTAWVAGDRGEAVTALRDALDHSLALDHLVSHCNALAQAALPIAFWSGNSDASRKHVATLAHNLGLRDIPIWRPVCRFYQGAIMSIDGDIEGVETMRSAIDQLIANNFVVRVPLYLTILAEASIHHSQFALARDSLSAAFERADRQEEYWSQPELLRVRGLLRWLDGDLPGASETLSLAVETARESGASFFQLRAATALAELWAQTDRHEPAVELLSPICSSFDEMSPCINMVKANHLLETLRRRASGAS